MLIRPMSQSDIGPCALLFVTVFNGEPWHEPWSLAAAQARLRDAFHAPGAHGLVADEDGNLLALALGRLEHWSGDEKHFYLQEMCVERGRQRRGIGTALVRELADRMKHQGVARMYLLTARGGPAEAFYARCGFRASGKMILTSRPL